MRSYRGSSTGGWLEKVLGPAFPDVRDMMADKALVGRVCSPDDVCDAIVGLVEGSDMVTGQLLVVDGGSGIAG